MGSQSLGREIRRSTGVSADRSLGTGGHRAHGSLDTSVSLQPFLGFSAILFSLLGQWCFSSSQPDLTAGQAIDFPKLSVPLVDRDREAKDSDQKGVCFSWSPLLLVLLNRP